MIDSNQETGHEHGHGRNRLAVPAVCERLGADASLTGRGVTIAFLDSGFVRHPDLARPEDRIVAYHDVVDPASTLQAAQPREWHWHGTQTSVVAAGNGFLSDGLYRGLASEARVVLVKVGVEGGIPEENIAKGLEWVLANRERYGIRVVSISLGGDEDAPLVENRVNQLAEECVRRGLALVVAAGNSGCTDKHRSLPPATAPSVITVGGYEDGGDPSRAALALYCSSYGFTADGLVKPEIIALARGVAAPILPGTEAWHRAEALSQRADVAAEEALRAEKIVATHYQHVDGTSFAAPIVASVVAQMLEANPALTPVAVKHLLVTTARRIGEASALRQGFGVLDARRAVEAARGERHTAEGAHFAPPRVEEGRIAFVYHDDAAQNVAVAGDFNAWNPASTPFQRGPDGVWRAAMAKPAPGLYRYKLLVDGRWIEDPAHGAKEPDPFGSFNSLLRVS